MNSKNNGFPDDRTERQRRKDLSDEQVKELERAGGAEGGMQAGSAGGPDGSSPSEKARADSRQAARPGRSVRAAIEPLRAPSP